MHNRCKFLSGYFRIFVSGYSRIARPLSDLLKMNVKFQFKSVFDVDERNAFERLKIIVND